MPRSSDFCGMYCGGRTVTIPRVGRLREEDLVICREGDRVLYFSIVGNGAVNPRVALVGLCPGYTQLRALIDGYNGGLPFGEAANVSGFRRMSRNIARMLRKIGIDYFLDVEIPDDFDFNRSPSFFTTSLVKCAALREGAGRSNEFQPLDYACTRLCLTHRFLEDILNPGFRRLEKVVIFGSKGKVAVCEPVLGGRNVRQVLEAEDKELIFLPHPSGSNNGRISQFLRG